MNANRSLILRWIERGLLALGSVLAVWCAAVLLEAQFTKQLPIPPLVVTQSLPGDANPSSPSRPRPAPAAGTVLARITAPTVKMATMVLEGSDDATLNRGAGHIEDTPFPGERGNIGIAGHRDTVFRPLKGIRVGDPMELTTSDRVYHYRVKKTLIVMPEDVYVLDPTAAPTVTLVTCYPFEYIGHAPKRFIVQAELVGEEARSLETGKIAKPGLP
jgi:LPXTG-site transpeptidase (sortase) family protein